MAVRHPISAMEWLLNRRAAARWTRHARALAQGRAGLDAASTESAKTDLAQLRLRRAAAQALRPALSQFLHEADSRLGLPRIGATQFPRPSGTDWSWRPVLWRAPLDPAETAALVGPASHTAIGDEVKIFHDCPRREIILRQNRSLGAGDLAPYGLSLDVFGFAGSFLSLALDLPQAALAGLSNRHLIRLDMTLRSERPCEIYLRLNVQHGPNVAQLGQSLPHGTGATRGVEFDLGYEKLNEKRIEKAWVDVLVSDPQMNRITFADLTMARYPRAPI